MAGNLYFPIDGIRQIIEWAKTNSAPHGIPLTYLFDAKYHKGGIVVEKDGWPDADNIDLSTIKPHVLWVKDHGTYFIAGNHVPKQSPVIYADGMAPGRGVPSDGWYDRMVAVCGGDDFAEPIDVDELEAVLGSMPSAKFLRLTVSDGEFRMAPVMRRGS